MGRNCRFAWFVFWESWWLISPNSDLCCSCCYCCAALPEEQGRRRGGRVGPVLPASQGHVKDQCGWEDHCCQCLDSSLYSLLWGWLPTGTPHPIPKGPTWIWSGSVHNQRAGGGGGAGTGGGGDRRVGGPSTGALALAQFDPKRNCGPACSTCRTSQLQFDGEKNAEKWEKVSSGDENPFFRRENNASVHVLPFFQSRVPQGSSLCRDHQTSLAPVTSPSLLSFCGTEHLSRNS